MANDWDVVSQEPVATAPTRRPQQASAADDPWAVVESSPMVNGIPLDIAMDPDLQFGPGAPPLTDPYYSQPRPGVTPRYADAMAGDPDHAWDAELADQESSGPSILDLLSNPIGVLGNA